jgi:hypothetical protein
MELNRAKYSPTARSKDLGGEDGGRKIEDGAETPPAASLGSLPSSIFHLPSSLPKGLDLDRRSDAPAPRLILLLQLEWNWQGC